MTRIAKNAMLIAAAALATTAVAGGAHAQAQAHKAGQSTPKSWNYEIKDGKRVPKAERVTNADGSWREEVRQGNCVTVKESNAAGEVKISRKCG